MFIPPKLLVYLALISILAGIVVKLFGIDFSEMGIMTQFPVKPQSFINFAEVILLLAISITLLRKKDYEE